MRPPIGPQITIAATLLPVLLPRLAAGYLVASAKMPAYALIRAAAKERTAMRSPVPQPGREFNAETKHTRYVAGKARATTAKSIVSPTNF